MDDFFDALLGLLGEVGKDIAEAAVIDIIADNGVKICKGIKQVIIGNNGQTSSFTELVETKEIGYAGAGAAIFTTEVGVLGAALAPVLGIPLGFILYEAAPEFWTGLSEKLVEGGRTIKNKVIGFFDKDGKTYYDDITINITKDYFIKYGLYNKSIPTEIEGFKIERDWRKDEGKYEFEYDKADPGSSIRISKIKYKMKNTNIKTYSFLGRSLRDSYYSIMFRRFPIYKTSENIILETTEDGDSYYKTNTTQDLSLEFSEYNQYKNMNGYYIYKSTGNLDYGYKQLNSDYPPNNFLYKFSKVSTLAKNFYSVAHSSRMINFYNAVYDKIKDYYIWWQVGRLNTGGAVNRENITLNGVTYSATIENITNPTPDDKSTYSYAPIKYYAELHVSVPTVPLPEGYSNYFYMSTLYSSFKVKINDVDVQLNNSSSTYTNIDNIADWECWVYFWLLVEEEYGTSQAMPNAEIPEEDKPINETSPRYIPVPIGGKPMFPVNLKPELEITQEEAQDPDPIDPEDAQDLQDDIEDFEPNPQEDNPQPPPSPQPPSTPDIPDAPELPVVPTPPIPIIPPIPVLPDTPVTTSSSKLFTVYNPTSTILDSVGNFLWSGDLFNELIKVWSNPMNSIISLIAVYCNVSTSSSGFIKFGKFESTIMCPIVSNQFTDIFCGYVDIPEFLHNATDYTPYTQIHVYLPYIGYVEVDSNDFINGKMRIDYRVDVYTGTCLATISAKRVRDMPEDTPLYQFSGNCSQQIPLTGESASGFLSMLSQIVGMGAISATGGKVTASRVAGTASQSLSHEMVHISHSGGISSNAGILGHEKPMVIITRRNSYEANSYNDFYGYPANMRGTLSNFHGFNKVTSIILTSLSATQEEKNEIVSILTEGVFI